MPQLIFLCLEVTVYACYFRKLMKCFRGRVDKVAENHNKTGYILSNG